MKYIKKGPQEIVEHNEEAFTALRTRLIIPAVIILIFFTLLMLRLWSLQVDNGAEYLKRAESNRVRERQIAPPRGRILDHVGREIVTNRPSFDVVLIREGKRDIGPLLEDIAPILGESVTELWGKVREGRRNARYEPIVLKKDVDWQTLAYLENHNHEFSGIRVEVTPVRVYHYGDLAANSIGYIGSISKKALEKADPTLYRGGDIVGRRGIEKLFEPDLRGEKGSRKSEVNSKGFEQRLLQQTQPLPGKDIYLTIDAELQHATEALMNVSNKAGAVVVMEVKTGKVLVAASTPSIHLEDFVGGISSKKWNALVENKERTPLINKVVQATYPPGSTYKMVVAYAALAEGLIDDKEEIYCGGSYKFGNRRFGCWNRYGHGKVDLIRAIGGSCDVYFYQLGERLGIDKLAEYSKKFGFGEKTGIRVEHEKSGLVPTKRWKQEVRNQRWQQGETLNAAIGQGFNLMTPLQIARMTAMVANKGTLFKPQIIEKIVDVDGNVVESFSPIIESQITGKDKVFDLIQQGMLEVVYGKRATARKVAIKGLTIAGKTGTAQVVSLSRSKGLKDDEIPYMERDHAWFTAFAPAEDPEIAVTVLVEHGLAGGRVAGPVARSIFKAYFRERLKEVDVEEKK